MESFPRKGMVFQDFIFFDSLSRSQKCPVHNPLRVGVSVMELLWMFVVTVTETVANVRAAPELVQILIEIAKSQRYTNNTLNTQPLPA